MNVRLNSAPIGAPVASRTEATIAHYLGDGAARAAVTDISFLSSLPTPSLTSGGRS